MPLPPIAIPVQSVSSERSVTPSSWMNSGRNGYEKLKPMRVTTCVIATTLTVRCHERGRPASFPGAASRCGAVFVASPSLR